VTSEDFAQRLKDDGRWDEFKEYRTSLEKQGYSKKESYKYAASVYGPDSGGGSPPASSSPSGAAPPELPDKYAKGGVFEGKTSSLKQDYQWVYDNIAIEDLDPESAPSSGAWGLLQFARSDSKSFYVEWMRMVSRQESSDEVMEGFAQDATRSTNEIASMVRLLREAAGLGSPEDTGGEPPVPSGDSPKERKRQGSSA
tara:strand:+ start:388 stop:981 length:594 start_codon:yes stop_codon:yes gene_type:complete